jgi:hypothetical protein
MISPLAADRDAGRKAEPWASEIRQIRETFKKSGLYRNDGSTDPLWTVDWYADHLVVASDGVHLVRHGPWPTSKDDEAIAFFANGELLRSYQIRELVDIPILLPHSVSHFEWLKSDAFDETKLEYALTTYDGSRIVFDVRTGEIVSSLRPTRLIGGPIAAVALCVVAWLLIQHWRRKRQKGLVESISTPPTNHQA